MGIVWSNRAISWLNFCSLPLPLMEVKNGIVVLYLLDQMENSIIWINKNLVAASRNIAYISVEIFGIIWK